MNKAQSSAEVAGFDTPVLLVIFNRPGHTAKVIEALSAARPRRLLVAADGPRQEAERDLCNQTRAVLQNINWECDVDTNFADENMGCGVRVHTAVSWAISRHGEVVVLEDDCIPTPGFFQFCQRMLELYRHDERVMHISGNNFQQLQPSCEDGYYFSKYTHAWGWATWRRAWQYFDWTIAAWPELKKLGLTQDWCADAHEAKLWNGIFDEVLGGKRDVWDYQWNFCCWSQHGLSILPSVNLVTNIGWGEDATHTKHLNSFLNLPAHDAPVVIPKAYVTRDMAADEFTFLCNYGGAEMRRASSLKARIGRPFRVVRSVLGRVKRHFLPAR